MRKEATENKKQGEADVPSGIPAPAFFFCRDRKKSRERQTIPVAFRKTRTVEFSKISNQKIE